MPTFCNTHARVIFSVQATLKICRSPFISKARSRSLSDFFAVQHVITGQTKDFHSVILVAGRRYRSDLGL